MKKCEICKYQKECPDIVEENSIYCLTHRRIPKNFNNEYIKKQRLISFLKDKLEIIDNEIKFKLLAQQGTPILLQEISELRQISLIYQEVLDFVKGDKNE